jgi:hypothetical protein
MYEGTMDHGKIIEAFRRNVPGCYVRDYRDRGGFITVCRQFRDIRWGDQLDAGRVERQVPATTLINLPRGTVTAATHFKGLRLHRTGWKREFRRASRHLSDAQMRGITEYLNVGEVFPGVIAR